MRTGGRMIPTDRFIPLAVQRLTEFQPESPVYVHCIRRSVERESGAVLLQVRMVNCGEREIRTVFLSVEGLDAFGKTVYRVRELPVTDCAAVPHGIFGEERMLALPRTEVDRLRVTVEHVVFADGTRWQRLPSHRLCTPQEAGCVACACGFPNPPERNRCLVCGNALPSEAQMPQTEVGQSARAPAAALGRPAPIVRSFTPTVPLFEEEETPRWALALLFIFGGAAILAAIAFITFCLTGYGA